MVWHLAPLPHVPVSDRYYTDAYVTKTHRLARMFPHDLVVYGEVLGVEHVETVPVLDRAEQEGHFGTWNASENPPLEFDPDAPGWQAANTRTAEAIRARWQPGDLLLLTAGRTQAPIVAALPNAANTTVEWAVGYSGVIGKPWRIYESHAWLHHVGGLNGESFTPRWYDAVVPNFFDPEQLPVGPGDGGYLLWIGRWTDLKGWAVAIEVAGALGLEIVLAGPGYDDTYLPAHASHIGPLDPEQRAYWMGRATACLVPTLYVEPFGGVACEAMLCGTPAITTDWGAFTESIPEQWRFRTLGEAVDAIKNLDGDDRLIAAERGRAYSMEAVRPRMERALRRIEGLWGGGWSAL